MYISKILTQNGDIFETVNFPVTGLLPLCLKLVDWSQVDVENAEKQDVVILRLDGGFLGAHWIHILEENHQ